MPPITFESEAHENAYHAVKNFGQELFGELFFEAHEDRTSFQIKYGSSIVQVQVSPISDSNSVVRILSYVVTDIEHTTELYEYLLTTNLSLSFGAFSLDEDGDICLIHTIVGDTLDKLELSASVMAICDASDEYDDIITNRWGGRRAVD